jgi:hypothetical protein
LGDGAGEKHRVLELLILGRNPADLGGGRCKSGCQTVCSSINERQMIEYKDIV